MQGGSRWIIGEGGLASLETPGLGHQPSPKGKEARQCRTVNFVWLGFQERRGGKAEKGDKLRKETRPGKEKRPRKEKSLERERKGNDAI